MKNLDENTLPELPDGWFVSIEARLMSDPFRVLYRATLCKPNWDKWNPVDQAWIDFAESGLEATHRDAVLAAIVKIPKGK